MSIIAHSISMKCEYNDKKFSLIFSKWLYYLQDLEEDETYQILPWIFLIITKGHIYFRYITVITIQFKPIFILLRVQLLRAHRKIKFQLLQVQIDLNGIQNLECTVHIIFWGNYIFIRIPTHPSIDFELSKNCTCKGGGYMPSKRKFIIWKHFQTLLLKFHFFFLKVNNFP